MDEGGVNAEPEVVFDHDDDSLVVSATRGSNQLVIDRDPATGRITGTTLGVVMAALDYDPVFGELSGYSAAAGSTSLLEITYERDALGRIATKTESVLGSTPITYTYIYDESGRLHQVKENGDVVSEYDYDDNSNRIGGFTPSGGSLLEASYDDRDRLVVYTTGASGVTEYAYTANGELKSKTTSEGTTTYEYDAAANLRHVTLPNEDEIEYVVDGRGRRVGKKLNGTLVQGFLYRDQLNPVAELDGEGNVVAEFIYATNRHSPDAMLKDGTLYHLIADHLGSVRLVVDSETGGVVQRIDYDEFGDVFMDTAPAFQPFGFAGGEHDTNTGFDRFGARDYDSRAGRWLAKDPIRFEGLDTNLFGYVFQDPINFKDPSGRVVVCVCQGATCGCYRFCDGGFAFSFELIIPRAPISVRVFDCDEIPPSEPGFPEVPLIPPPPDRCA